MMRFVSPFVAVTILLSMPAYAGFEWVAPSKKPAAIPAPTYSDEASTVTGGFAPPAVVSEPLDSGYRPTRSVSSAVVMSGTSGQYRAPVQRKTNLSGPQKLYIDPYPLRNESGNKSAEKISMTQVYKAMNEESKNLHPVKLGTNLSTGANKISAAIPKPVRVASKSHKTFLTPTNTGMTPMFGAEPAPLPGGVVRAPVKKSSANQNYVEAIGFGRDLPLALALSQVIPSDFTHSFAKDVDAGVSVSWEGGKPWNEVLNDMLSPQNLTSVIQGNQVIIQPSASL